MSASPSLAALLLAVSFPAAGLAVPGGSGASAEGAVERARHGGCPEVPGLAELLVPGAVLFLGEMHGSVESPAFVAGAACAARAAGLPVLVALELPVEETPRIEGFLDSAGAPADREALLAGAFWRDPFQDGRRSVAMLDLLDGLRALRRERGEVRFAAFDSERQPAGGQARDEEMAARLVTAVAAAPPASVVVVLAGNVHTRTVPGVPWNAEYRPMALLAAPRLGDRPVRSLDRASPPGAVWMCPTADPASCGEQPVGGGGDGHPRVELLPAPEGGHDGRYHLPSLRPSPPAVRAATPPTGPAPRPR